MKLVLLAVHQCTLTVCMLYAVRAVACESVSSSVIKSDIESHFPEPLLM